MWDLNVSVPDHCLSFYFYLYYKVNTYLSSLLLGEQTYFQFPSLPFTKEGIREVEEFTFRANPCTVCIVHSVILSFCNE